LEDKELEHLSDHGERGREGGGFVGEDGWIWMGNICGNGLGKFGERGMVWKGENERLGGGGWSWIWRKEDWKERVVVIIWWSGWENEGIELERWS
jgi:hypothetical protein